LESAVISALNKLDDNQRTQEKQQIDLLGVLNNNVIFKKKPDVVLNNLHWYNLVIAVIAIVS